MIGNLRIVFESFRHLELQKIKIKKIVLFAIPANNQLSTEQDRNSSEKAELEKRLNEMSALAQESSDKLEQMSDYETLKKELGILRSHEFSRSAH